MVQANSVNILESETIVDVDVHLSVTAELLSKYVDSPHDAYLRAPSVQLKSPGWDPTLGGKIAAKSLDTAESVRAEVCEGLYVDEPILNVFVNLSRFSDVRRAYALQRGCNNLLLDRFLDDTDFHGLASVATHRPDRAAEEIDRMGSERQIVGVFLPTTGPIPPLGDPSYDVLYEAMAENQLTPVFHGATNSGFDVGFPMYNRSFQKFVTAHVNAHLWSQSMTLTSLLVHGAPVKFPSLNFVILEAGIGWVPYMMFRLNKEIAMRRSEAPLLEKAPEEYVRERFYFATQPLGEPMAPEHMQQLLEMVGTDSLLFASDYPHWDFDHPSELNAHLSTFFDEDQRGSVLHKNATKAFKLH